MAGELILVVEDNEKNMKLARDILTFKGYQVAEAVTGEEALVIARNEQPALILMDIQLPGMDGVTAFKHLRADPVTKHIPVIALTASAMPTDRKQILAAGFDGYETKPLGVRRLIEVVNAAIDKASGGDSAGKASVGPREGESS